MDDLQSQRPDPLRPEQRKPSRADPGMPPDDDAIARALWRSLGVLTCLGILAAAAIAWLSRTPQAGRSILTPLSAPAALSATLHQIPRVRFTDITDTSGIAFHHVNGATGRKFLPETMGGGVAFFDFDNDGDPDLLFINSMHWPDSTPDDAPVPVCTLYRNDTIPGGPIRFVDVTAGSGLDITLYGMGVACADFDNDGWVDVYITALGENRLFKNLGSDSSGQPRFIEVTQQADVAGPTHAWSTAATWVDLDRDGLLDLFVANYVEWTPELDLDINNQLVGIGRAYGRPWNFPGTLPLLYRNIGQGRFTNVTEGSGVDIRNPASGHPMAKSLAVAPIDLNQDGWMDLVVANDTVQNFVFTNRTNFKFNEIGAQSGVAFDAYGLTRGAMGIDAARFRSDNALAIAIGNFANEMNALYVAQPVRHQLLFADEAIAEGLGPASRLRLKFGLFFFDYDLDGRLDILTANGHIEEEIGQVQKDVSYRQPAQLFWNAGGSRTFLDVPPEIAGNDLFQPLVGRGSAYADIDGDGDLDVVITQVNGPARLFRNDLDTGANWLRLKLVGTASNRDAIGAWIRVRIGQQEFHRQVMPTKSYLSQSELPVTIGIGEARKVDEIRILWPSGQSQVLDAIPLRTTVTITEPMNSVAN